MLPINANGKVERGSAFGAVVVDEDDAAVSKPCGIDPGVGVGEIGGVRLRPGEAVVE